MARKTHWRSELIELDWSHSQIYPILQAIGHLIGNGRIYPHLLGQIPQGKEIWFDHEVKIYHRRGRELGQRKAKYFIDIEGPVHAGSWCFFSGELERLARSTLDKKAL